MKYQNAMKCVIGGVSLFVLSSLFYGCVNLEEEPKGLFAPESFFQTPADVEAMVIGAYAEWVTTQIEKEFFLALMLRGDMVDIGDRNTSGNRIGVNDFSMNPENSLISLSWTRIYQSISAANSAIKGVRQISATDNKKNELEAKARFIRAFSYYHLVRCFGAVPYLSTPIESADVIASIHRTPEKEIYDEITKDLIFAKNHLSDQNIGDARNIATKGSAATILSEVYLTLKQYDNAVEEARFVINNADRFNYGLEKNYQDLFNANLSGTLREPIFTIDLKNDLNDGAYNQRDGMINLTRIRDYAPRSLSVAVPSLKVYESWDERDYRKSVSFEDSVLINGEKTGLINSGFKVPRPHIAKYYRYPGPQNGGDDRSSDHHYALYRYADVLLIAAEAIAESQGVTDEAVGYVNQIRARARFNGTEFSDFPGDVGIDLSQEDFIDLIHAERKLEFAFEFKRWYDIKRWGILEDAYSGPNSLEPHNIDPAKDYLFPIPQTEIDVTNFQQNPGY